MLNLESSELVVQLLDPEQDQDRLGPRYCCGGYIYQVFDNRGISLLTGPRWPEKHPNVFDGQGAPEAFNRFPDAEHVEVGGSVGVIGVGDVRRSNGSGPFDPRYDRDVRGFLAWTVTRDADRIVLSTKHQFGARHYSLTKTVGVDGRLVRSGTAISNLGADPLPVRWFAHPFFPIPPEETLFQTNIGLKIPANPGFYTDTAGAVCRRSGHNWPQGCFVEPSFPTQEPLVLQVTHPVVGSVLVSTDFAPSKMPIWGNENTFSMEPYLDQMVEPRASLSWSITYQLGE